MKSGHINQYAHLSQFQTVQQFNETIEHYLAKYGDQLTKGERLSFQILTRFSVREIGICNARICKLVEAAQTEKGGISRSTFERMLRKVKRIGIITIHHTIREKGGFSHNVYIFNRLDGAISEKLTDRQAPKKQATATVQSTKMPEEAISFKTKISTKDLRHISLEKLDYTYVPSYVPAQFTNTVKPFFDRAKEICQFWDRALIAYRSMKFTEPIECFLPIIIKAFKESVFKYKEENQN